jgi:2-methylcitrate dehydratase PrpD
VVSVALPFVGGDHVQDEGVAFVGEGAAEQVSCAASRLVSDDIHDVVDMSPPSSLGSMLATITATAANGTTQRHAGIFGG